MLHTKTLDRFYLCYVMIMYYNQIINLNYYKHLVLFVLLIVCAFVIFITFYIFYLTETCLIVNNVSTVMALKGLFTPK